MPAKRARTKKPQKTPREPVRQTSIEELPRLEDRELPQTPAEDLIPEPEPIGGRRGPHRSVEQRDD